MSNTKGPTSIATYLFLPVSVVLNAVISMVYSILSRRVVTPAEYGLFTTANLFAGYLAYLQLGTLNAYARDYPRFLGAGEVEKAQRVKNVTLSFIAVVLLAVSIVIIVCSFLLKPKVDGSDITYGLILAVIAAILSVLFIFIDNTVKAECRFGWASVITMVRSASLISIGYFCVYKIGYYGLYIAALVPIVAAIVFNLAVFKNVKFQWDNSLILEQIKSGAPLLVNTLVWMLMSSVDKFVILGFMNTETLGIYSVAMTGFSTMILVPSTLSQMYYMRMSQEYGAHNDKVLLLKSANDYSETLGLISAIVVVFGFWAIPPFVNWVLPNYAGGITSANVLIIGVALYTTSMLYGNILSILKLNRELLKYSFLLCVFNATLSVLLVCFVGREIIYVALGASISYALYSVVVINALCRYLKTPVAETVARAWLPVILSLSPTLLLGYIFTTAPYVYRMAFAILIGLLVTGVFYWKKIRTLLK